ncbi:MAG: hypothetical protein AAGG11_08020 [Pseudomonadota bacterium]
MSLIRNILIGIVLLAAVLAVLAPIGPLPGFFIGGTEATVPERWPDTTEQDEILLQVPGTPPRVVTIWVVDYEGVLHVVGAPDSGWVTQLGEGGPVKMRLGDNTYALTAERITDGWQAILGAYIEKYEADYPDIVAEFPPVEEAEGQFALFRLDRG